MTSSAEQNKAHFNNVAAQYDTKFEKSLQQLTEAIQSRLDFIGVDWADDDDDDDDNDDQQDSDEKNKEDNARTPNDSRQVRLLDYACGTGMISRALGPYTTQCVGVDVSENMVGAFNARAENQGLTKEDMFAVVGNLAVPDDPAPAALSGPEFFNFDIAAVGGGFHHFDDPEFAATRLIERLKPGGVLFIWDFLTHEHDHDYASHGVVHHGFSKDQVRNIFEKAGAGENFALDDLGSGVVFPHGHGHDGQPLKRRAFVARGEKKMS
ncbi:hypothetical protein E8E14_013326 [Neopestalotiopsis sp. 37M]|nr:hypothetical protein E8E14_013326 [Neopestalotiopsis sp. 37M]